jgi:hypothetical protein
LIERLGWHVEAVSYASSFVVCPSDLLHV